MRVVVDVLKETVVIVDKDGIVLDGFEASGITRREVPDDARYYTYKRHLIWSGQCALCHLGSDQLDQVCVSRSGYHAIVDPPDSVEAMHRASAWDLSLHMIRAEDLVVYVSPDNMYSIVEIAEPLEV
ncbi:MAG: hypothetical protein KDC35_04120 [Acidobacteria bacterium]|nr:hypothetical protein [Acidobacteriota bacterium]